jgi:hypothetical protein
MPQIAFDPEVHGFAFENSWEFDEAERRRLRDTFATYLTWGGIVGAAAFRLTGAILFPLGILALRNELESRLAPRFGLCGGMSFAVLDFYKAGRCIPRGQHRDDRPAPGTDLRDYIWRRQVDSVLSDGATFLAWMTFLYHVRPGWPFHGGPGWLLTRSEEEWRRLKNFIDRDDPIPLGLVRETENMFDNHQVLAIGYEEANESHGSIILYDPNCPDQVSTIDLAFGQRQLEGWERCNRTVLRGFFCENYRFVEPPASIGET